ncbi:MAG TPA: Kiwa anti-phage protein KwaB-like domain-containing protein [Candidatus Saccharimonadales bacterium]|nr:Kiwa anti-phage protein KwaB-like domain-containing protein [Candidatus Saccharimonadales bacterium]
MDEQEGIAAAENIEQSTQDVPTDTAPAEVLAAAPSVQSGDILGPVTEAPYEQVDVFAWANNLVQYKDEIAIELFLFNKNYVLYRTKRAGDLNKQMEPLFIDEILEYVLEGADIGLTVRGFEEAEAEEHVLQRTRVKNVDKLVEVLGWLKTQEHEIELFNEEEHDIKRIKGVVARCRHKDLPKPFYVIKALPQSQIMKGKTGWMIRDNKFVAFDADAALRIPSENQLLVVDQDLFVFNQGKLKALFGYDAKEASIAEKKVREIEEHFKLSFAEGLSMQSLVKGKRATIKKLQKIEPSQIKQDDLVDHAEELGLDLMLDDNGAIIIMDDGDLTKFVNLLNDDYIESPLTGLRYEIKSKRLLKPPSDEDLLKSVLK